MSEKIKKLQFTIGDVAYPDIDISHLKSFPRTYAKFSHPFLLEKGVEWVLRNFIDECTTEVRLVVRTVHDEQVRFKVLERFLWYGIYEDGRIMVKTQGMRRRRTSLKRLQQLGVIRILEKEN